MSTQTPEQERTRAEQQADDTAAKVLALLALYQAGQIADSDFPSVVATAVYQGKCVASRIADVLVSTLAGLPALGILPGSQHIERLEKAASTALADPETAPERLERLASAEVLTSHSKTLNAAIRENRLRWREDVSPTACDVCLPFADVEHEADEEFEPHHPNCRCEPVPITN